MLLISYDDLELDNGRNGESGYFQNWSSKQKEDSELVDGRNGYVVVAQ